MLTTGHVCMSTACKCTGTVYCIYYILTIYVYIIYNYIYISTNHNALVPACVFMYVCVRECMY